MLPPFLGQLLLLATLAALVLCTMTGLWARGTHRPGLARWAVRIGGVSTALYAAFWLLGIALAPAVELTPGKEVSFCGLDCHLHVSVAGLRSEADLMVTVAFRSDAVAAPEFPAELRFRLRDAAGREYDPLNTIPDAPLAAGERREHVLHFSAGIAPAGASLIVTWRAGLDYLVPGSGNPLAQARKRLALQASPGAGA